MFYEDLTNLAVVGVKFLKNDAGVAEPEFNCIYTYDDDGRSKFIFFRLPLLLGSTRFVASCVPSSTDPLPPLPSSHQGLHFKLRQSSIPNPPSSTTSTSAPSTRTLLVYQPLGLEKESPEFVKSLEFLDKGFSTDWDKANIFWKTIVERVGTVEEDEEDEE